MDNQQLPYAGQPAAARRSPGAGRAWRGRAAGGAAPPPAPAAAGAAAGVLGVPAAGGGARVGVGLQEPPAAAGADQEDHEGGRGRAHDLGGGARAVRQGVRALHPGAHHPLVAARRGEQAPHPAAQRRRRRHRAHRRVRLPRRHRAAGGGQGGARQRARVRGGGPPAPLEQPARRGLPYYYPPMGQPAPMMPAWHVPAWDPAWQQGAAPDVDQGAAGSFSEEGQQGFAGHGGAAASFPPAPPSSE